MIARRIYPHVHKPFSAVVDNSEIQFGVNVVEVSSQDVCIQCNTLQRNMITPEGCFVRNGKPLELLVWLNLPVDYETVEQVGVRCQVMFSRRISNNQCQIGLRYLQLDEAVYMRLVKYIESSLRSEMGLLG